MILRDPAASGAEAEPPAGFSLYIIYIYIYIYIILHRFSGLYYIMSCYVTLYNIKFCHMCIAV